MRRPKPPKAPRLMAGTFTRNPDPPEIDGARTPRLPRGQLQGLAFLRGRQLAHQGRLAHSGTASAALPLARRGLDLDAGASATVSEGLSTSFSLPLRPRTISTW